MTKYIFPITLILLDLGAAFVYALGRDFKMTIYWVAAAVLNCCVTFQKEGVFMAKSEHRIQDEIRLALSKYGIVLRLNSGQAYGGTRIWDKRYGYILKDIRPIALCGKGTPDLLFIGEDGKIAFETPGFSTFAGFTVDFAYDGEAFSIDGLTNIKLSEVFENLKKILDESDEFFIIDSNNIDSIENRLYGYAKQNK